MNGFCSGFGFSFTGSFGKCSSAGGGADVSLWYDGSAWFDTERWFDGGA